MKTLKNDVSSAKRTTWLTYIVYAAMPAWYTRYWTTNGMRHETTFRKYFDEDLTVEEDHDSFKLFEVPPVPRWDKSKPSILEDVIHQMDVPRILGEESITTDDAGKYKLVVKDPEINAYKLLAPLGEPIATAGEPIATAPSPTMDISSLGEPIPPIKLHEDVSPLAPLGEVPPEVAIHELSKTLKLKYISYGDMVRIPVVTTSDADEG